MVGTDDGGPLVVNIIRFSDRQRGGAPPPDFT
jgi:hypothetical protein